MNVELSFQRNDDFGFLTLTASGESFAGWYPNTGWTEPGPYTLEPTTLRPGDFNGDGREDVLVVVGVAPHFVPRGDGPPSRPVLLLNDGDHGFSVAPETIWADGPPEALNLYRAAVEDFNGDGVDDFAIGGHGSVDFGPEEGVYVDVTERMRLFLSQPDGTFADASDWIPGQGDGGKIEGFGTHDIGSGDVDGNGAPDIYIHRRLFLNDGTGRFTDATDRLPEGMHEFDGFVMSSLVADFDGDGYADPVALKGEGDERDRFVFPTTLMLSGGEADISARRVATLPPGLYGPINTKNNFAAAADLDGDGALDIVISQTRADPYYSGQQLQILINDGAGGFTDESAGRLDQADLREANALGYFRQGEGEVFLRDIDRDGDIDILSATVDGGDKRGFPGTIIWLNDGAGQFERVATSAFPAYDPGEFEEIWWDPDYAALPPILWRSVPVDADGWNGLDLVTFFSTSLLSDDGETNQKFFFTLLSAGYAPTEGPDRLNGVGGPDVVDALGGDDIVKTWAGDDLIDLGSGHDLALSGDGDDTIFGGDGDDTIKPGRGNDSMDGGSGDDILMGFRGDEILIGGAGDDTLLGGLDDDTIAGGAGDDRLQGGPGRDVFVFDAPEFGHDRIVLDFRPGSDAIDFRGSGLRRDDLEISETAGKVKISVIGHDSSIVVAADRIGPLSVEDFDDGVLIF